MPNAARLLAPILLLATASACSAPPTQPEPAMPASETPVAGFVTDLPAFDRFVAGRPTPVQFQVRYPDVNLVLPGQIATKEFRMNNSRYFATLDGEGRITGGRFQ